MGGVSGKRVDYSQIFALAAALTYVCVFRKQALPIPRVFFAGFFALMGSLVFTVVEGIAWMPFFNLLEHICLAVSGVFFALASLRLMSGRPKSGRGQGG